jgi:hypothetical protein
MIKFSILYLPIYCEANFPIGSSQTVFYGNKLMNCKILGKHHCRLGQYYNVKVLEYPAKKRVRQKE